MSMEGGTTHIIALRALELDIIHAQTAKGLNSLQKALGHLSCRLSELVTT